MRQFGLFNVGWISFVRGNVAESCLYEWQQNCFSWCFNHVENGKYADQKIFRQMAGVV